MLNHVIGRIFGRAVGCPCHEELFDFALDGMDTKQQEKVRQHLADCPSCCDQVKDFAWVSEGIALSAPQMDPPANICDKVKARIRAESESVQAPVMRLGRDPLAGWPRFWMRLGPLFALSSLMMTALAFFAVFVRPSAKPTLPLATEVASRLLNSPSMILVSLAGQGESKDCAVSLFAAPGFQQILLKVKGLKACSQGAAYALWCSEKGGKASRLGSFQAVDGVYTYVLSLPKPWDDTAKALDFEVTQEALSNPSSGEKGPTRLRGRYNL
jgi:hypothetical protein